MTSKPQILVPVDFKYQSLAAWKFSKKVAESISGDINLLYVIEEPGYILLSVLKGEMIKAAHIQADEKLTGIWEKDNEIKLMGAAVRNVVMQGKVYTKIIEASKEVKPEFIIMGRKADPDLKRNISGTNTVHIIREAKAPVITLNDTAEIIKDDKILLPLDLTKPIREKLCKAVEMAQKLEAEIHVLSVLRSSHVSKELEFVKVLHCVEDLLNKFDIKNSTKLIEDKKRFIYQIVNEYAKEIACDMIMVMTQEEIGVREYFVGSNAQDMINKAELPVISVIPNPEIKKEIKDTIFKDLVDPVKIFE
jgi:nucleotide-binding universal stress UspA family protein